MPELAKKKDEAMAQLLARGFDKTNAHEMAGFKRNTGNAHTKANDPEMVARVQDLKEKYAAENTRKKELDLTDANEIDEDWLIDKYRALHDKALETGDWKAAKLCLDEIGAMKTLGDQNVKANNSKALDLKNDANTPPPVPAISLQIFNQGPEGFTDGAGGIALPAKDITPREDEMGGSDDGDNESAGAD